MNRDAGVGGTDYGGVPGRYAWDFGWDVDEAKQLAAFGGQMLDRGNLNAELGTSRSGGIGLRRTRRSRWPRDSETLG